MSISPSFSFFIPGEKGSISPGSPLWQLPLSGNYSGFSKNIQATDAVKESGLTIGDYFTAARTFLESKNCNLLASALSALAGKGESPIQAVELFLEKHGAFYHPIRVKVWSEAGQSAELVLNGAVSGPGLSLIEKEYQLLANLESHVSTAYTPRVFGTGIQTLEVGNPENSNLEKKDVGFFLGEWFGGFREFHISTLDGERKVAVWASNGDIDYLPMERAQLIYEQISYILTVYYNIDTGEQIFPWHHAAGDFVVNPLDQGCPVKLITVRGYDSLMEFDPGTGPGEMILPSLLFFFLNLTLRMQIDRLDGVGSLVFLGEIVLEATVRGFLRGLDEKAEESLAPKESVGIEETKGIAELREVFVEFMAGFSQEQIESILTNLIEAWPKNASERTLAGGYLESHSAFVHSLFKNR
ncbi:MAG: hypothetical protein GY860_06750 [Desulfobacteraceae bacterium]|nr:hypothetical protein [Desulfobacteraceae bacterium]